MMVHYCELHCFCPRLELMGRRKWCLDANAVAQEKGIEAVLAIVQYSGETSAKLVKILSKTKKATKNGRAGGMGANE